jgi:hypothetical protein
MHWNMIRFRVARFFLIHDTKMNQMNTKCNKRSWNIPNVCKIFQKTIKNGNIIQSKALQNLPKLGFLVWKQTIWQPWFDSETAYSDTRTLSLLSCSCSHSLLLSFLQERSLSVSGSGLYLLCKFKRCYFFPNSKLQNAKILTVSFPNFKSLNGQIFEQSNFWTVICLTDQMFDKS